MPCNCSYPVYNTQFIPKLSHCYNKLMNKNCEICQLLDKPAHILMQTPHWRVSVSNNQAYLGRAYITLRTHKEVLGKLTVDEWREYQEIVQKLENAYIQAFDASPINWCCFMDHAYREDEPQPHVHWHVIPRYKQAPQIGDIVFDDSEYGDLFDHKAERLVSDSVVGEIMQRLKAYL